MRLITPHSLLPILDEIFKDVPNILSYKPLMEIKHKRGDSTRGAMTDPVYVNLHFNGNKITVGWDQYTLNIDEFKEEIVDLRKYENETVD